MPPQRIRYAETSADRKLSREADGDAITKVVDETIQLASDEDRRSRTSRLIMIQGEAGIGKTWFLDYLHEQIAAHQSTKRVVKRFDAESFAPPSPALHYRFLSLLKECDDALSLGSLPPLPDPDGTTIELVAEWTGLLETRLAQISNRPLVFLFDEMEWWANVDEAEQATLTHLLRIVWAMLLRQAQLPVIIICAGRRIPPFKHPLLRLVSYSYPLKGFKADKLAKLVESTRYEALLPLIIQYTEDNPWATQILNIVLGASPDGVIPPSIPEEKYREIFDALVGDQLDQDLVLKNDLYQLAQQRQEGFTANDPLLSQGDTTLKKLVNTSFVEFDSRTKRYFVIPVLARWFKRSKSNDPQ
jgi:hypothetical protein